MSLPLKPPPGPTGWPFFGVIRDFRKSPAQFLMRISKEYGDTSYFRLGLQKVFFVNRPELIDEVLVSGAGAFRKSRMLQRATVLLGDSLLTTDGPYHVQQRKLIQPAFYRERLMSYASTMTALADRARSRLSDGVTVDMADEMMRLTLAIVCQTLFSRDVERDASEIGQAMTTIVSGFDKMVSPFAGLMNRIRPDREAERAQELLDRKIYEIIAERRAEGVDRGDLLSTLLAKADNGEGMTDKQVRDEALTLMVAGHETTATALTWTWYLLSQNPAVEERLRAEWRDVLGGRLPTFEDLPALEYTERVFAESMRLYPPAWAIGRMARREFRLLNFVIPKGGIVVMSPYVMHRHKQFWPNPDRFDPERFTAEAKASRPKFSYFPFGGGPRVCIGERFAWMEGALLLATIGQRWRFRLAEGQQVDVLPQITLRPRYGMKMVVERVLA